MPAPRKYPEELKRRAVRLVREDGERGAIVRRDATELAAVVARASPQLLPKQTARGGLRTATNWC